MAIQSKNRIGTAAQNHQLDLWSCLWLYEPWISWLESAWESVTSWASKRQWHSRTGESLTDEVTLAKDTSSVLKLLDSIYKQIGHIAMDNSEIQRQIIHVSSHAHRWNSIDFRHIIHHLFAAMLKHLHNLREISNLSVWGWKPSQRHKFAQAAHLQGITELFRARHRPFPLRGSMTHRALCLLWSTLRRGKISAGYGKALVNFGDKQLNGWYDVRKCLYCIEILKALKPTIATLPNVPQCPYHKLAQPVQKVANS